jgi:proline iminopeptidase
MTFHKLWLLNFVAILFILLSCKTDNKNNETALHSRTTVETGGSRLVSVETPNAKYNVWVKKIGSNPKLKVLLLHGGPAVPHDYLECFESFLPTNGIEMYYYDQLGCGYSDIPADTTLWNLPRFVEEVEQVRQTLQLDSSNFILLGHSWGGILAVEYALKYQHHLKGLVISNMMMDADAYQQYANELAKTFPANVANEIKAIEAAKDFANPRYMELLNEYYYQKHICRFKPEQMPEPVNRAFRKMNNLIYTIMQGPSEFGISGKLTHWSRFAYLKNIKTKTLVIGARFDTMDPKHMEQVSTKLPNGSYWFCPNGSHMCFYDDQQTYFKGLIDFLQTSLY